MELTQLASLDIEELTALLEAKIHYKMQDLFVLAEASKTLKGREKDKTYLAMAEIFNDMRPCEAILRNQNPHLETLFDSLGDLYDKNKEEKAIVTRTKTTKAKRKTVKRVIAHPDDQVAPQLDFHACMELNSFDKN